MLYTNAFSPKYYYVSSIISALHSHVPATPLINFPTNFPQCQHNAKSKVNLRDMHSPSTLNSVANDSLSTPTLIDQITSPGGSPLPPPPSPIDKRRKSRPHEGKTRYPFLASSFHPGQFLGSLLREQRKNFFHLNFAASNTPGLFLVENFCLLSLSKIDATFLEQIRCSLAKTSRARKNNTRFARSADKKVTLIKFSSVLSCLSRRGENLTIVTFQVKLRRGRVGETEDKYLLIFYADSAALPHSGAGRTH